MGNNYKRNQFGLKNSVDRYRIINGIYFEQWSFHTEEFDRLKKECIELGLKYRIIDGEFYRQRVDH